MLQALETRRVLSPFPALVRSVRALDYYRKHDLLVLEDIGRGTETLETALQGGHISDDQATEAAYQTGLWLADLHAAPPTALAGLSERSAERAQSFNKAVLHLIYGGLGDEARQQQYASEIKTELEEIGTRALHRARLSTECLTHGDCGLRNILLVPSPESTLSLRVLDFETAGLGDSAQDAGAIAADFLRIQLTRSGMPWREHDRSVLHSFFKGYCEIRPLSDSQICEIGIRMGAQCLLAASQQQQADGTAQAAIGVAGIDLLLAGGRGDAGTLRSLLIA